MAAQPSDSLSAGATEVATPNPGVLVKYNVDLIFININTNSDFTMLQTGTDTSIDDAVMQVTKHMARGLYRIVSLNASEHSCVVVMSTEKTQDELLWKNGFPWDGKHDPQPDVVLKGSME